MTSTRVKRFLKRSAVRLMHSVGGKSKGRWSIGIYSGDSPYTLGPTSHVRNPVLTYDRIVGTPALFVADPFMLRRDRVWHMLFEVMNGRTGRGEIGLATSHDLNDWAYRGIVLSEPFHLSYPYVFPWMKDYYMLPECYQTASIRLYKANAFPVTWQYETTLLSGADFVDPSIFRHNNAWWLFAATNRQAQHDTLRLYYADRLHGPWTEHPHSPVITNNVRTARPAGRIIVDGDRVIRYAQDGRPAYGTQVRAFEIIELTQTVYREREVDHSPVLIPTGAGWNRSRMHHIDAHSVGNGQWIACVDGWGSQRAWSTRHTRSRQTAVLAGKGIDGVE